MGERRYALVQQQARALGDPTRHQIFRLVETSTEGVEQQVEGVDLPAGGLSVKELAAALQLHESAVRQHLAKLLEAQLVTGETQPAQGPGRPRARFRRVPHAVAAWSALNPFERLSAQLLDVLATGLTPQETGWRAGHDIASTPGLDTEGGPTATLARVMEEQGFGPRVEPREHGVDVVLTHCPVASLALTAPQVVCEVHRGMAEGLGGASARLSDVDPLHGGCRMSFDSLYSQNPPNRTTAADSSS